MGLFLHSISSFFFKRRMDRGISGLWVFYSFFLVYIFFCRYIYRHFQISDIGQSLCVASAELSWSQNAFFNMWFMKSHGKRQTKKKILEKKKTNTLLRSYKKLGKKLLFQRIQNKHEIPFHRSNDMMHIKLDKHFFWS